jgi:phosphoribosylaminoimidazole-succinocarboxamide synthase
MDAKARRHVEEPREVETSGQVEAPAEDLLPYPLLRRGKVREMYDLGEHLLMVASDRISAFDCVLPQSIPRKGIVLTQLSRYWFDRTSHIVQNHCVAVEPDEIVALRPDLEATRERWAGRGMLVLRARPFPVECVVRGYLAGSAWKEYRESGTLAGEPLPEGLIQSQRLPEALFSPATKADEGHDENISFRELQRHVGLNTSQMLRQLSLALYRFGRDRAGERGIILADAKFEFGVTPSGEVLLIDEMLTPDSALFWLADRYEPGPSQPSLDKQPVRDYLETLRREGRWSGEPPPPDLPAEVVTATEERYLDAYFRLTGRELPSFEAS